MYSEILNILNRKIQTIEEDIKEAEQKLATKSRRRVRWFTNFIITEIALLHYFIYFNLSWDIMEPITVLLANLDIMAAYWFFILKGKPFSPEGWHTDIFSRKKYKHLLNSGIDVQKYF